MTVKRYETQASEIKLLPNVEQVWMLNTTHAKLQAARDAVCAAQRDVHGGSLTTLEIKEAESELQIPEVLDVIKHNVFHVATIRIWLSAGIKEGRGKAVDNCHITPIYNDPIKVKDGKQYLYIPRIGRVKLASPISELPKTVYLQFPDEDNADWRIRFYADASTNGTGDPADALPPVVEEPADEVQENPNGNILRESMLFLASALLKTDGLTEDQRTAIELVLEAFA